MRIRYANQLAVSEFDLQDQVNAMKGEGAILKAILGSTTQLDGFSCTPNSPVDLNVIVGNGTITILKDVLDTALGELPTQIPADTTHQIVKYAYTLDPTLIAVTPPATPGFSTNDLIQISFSELDGDPVQIPFFNGFTGQTINPPTFATKNTQRIDSVVITLKPGTPALTGTQSTPSPDPGYVGAWVVTTAEGQTTINSGDITEYPNAPFITEKLKDKISEATADTRYAQMSQVQSGQLTFVVGAGPANTYTASTTPALTAYTQGMLLNCVFTNTNTGPSTININGLGAVPITNEENEPLTGDELTEDGIILEYTGLNAFRITSVHMRQFGRSLSAPGYQRLPGGLVMQWGTTVNVPANNVPLTVSLPIAFTTAGLCSLSSYYIEGAFQGSTGIDFNGLSQINLTNSATAPLIVNWFVMGI